MKTVNYPLTFGVYSAAVSMVTEQIAQYIANYDKKIFGTINKYWAKAIKLIRAKEFLAELLGTFILVVSYSNYHYHYTSVFSMTTKHYQTNLSLSLQLIGDASIAQVVTSNGAAGGFLTVNIGYGIGLIVALFVSLGVSGGHLNPAVTLAMALRGKLSWLKVYGS